MRGAPTHKVTGALIAPVFFGAGAVGAASRGVVLGAQLGDLGITGVLALLLPLLLGLLLLGLGPPAAAGALPPHLLQVVEQVPLDILPDPGLLGDLLAPRIRVNT